MASTYSTNLALDLMANGDQSGTWGTTTNTNLGTLIEQAISGYVTQAITDGSGANTTITIPNGATGVARNMYIEMTGALTFSTTSLIVPANKKLYFIFNNTSGGFAVTVKVSGQTGVLVPNGKKVILTSNGTDIVEAANQVVGAFGVGGALTVTGAATVGTTLGVTGLSTLGTDSLLSLTTKGYFNSKYNAAASLWQWGPGTISTANAFGFTVGGTNVLDLLSGGIAVTGTLGVTGAAAFGGAVSTVAQTKLTGSWTGSGDAYGLEINHALTATSTNNILGVYMHQTAATGSVNHSYIDGLAIDTPTISGTGTVTNANTVRIAGAPTISGGGTITNAKALWVTSGATQLDGTLGVGGAAVGFGNGYNEIAIATGANGSMLYLQGSGPLNHRFYGNGSGLTYDASGATTHQFVNNGVNTLAINSAGAVTIPGTTTIGAASAGVGALTINHATQPAIYLAKTNATATTWQIYNNGNLQFYDGTNTPLYFVGAASTFGGKLTAQVSGMNAAIALGQVSDGTGYGTVTLNNAFAKDTLLGLRGNATGVDPTLYLNAPVAGTIEMRIANGASVVSVSSTALAVGSTYNLLVNGAAANGVFALLGRSGLSSMYVQRSNTAQSFGVEDDGNVYAGQIGASTGTALILSGGYIKTLTSSRRYKKDEEPIDIGLDFINTLKPIKFRLKENDLPQVGFIAEDFPDERLVDMSYIDIENKELGMRPESVHYSQITAPLVKAVQELSAKVAALEAAR